MIPQRYSWAGDDGMEIDSLGEYIKAGDYFHLEQKLIDARAELAELRARASLPDVEEIAEWIRGLGYTTSRQSIALASRVHRKLSARPALPKKGESNVE